MNKYSFGRRELLALGAVSVLAPVLRLFPTGATELAGRAVWLCALAALPVLLLYARFLTVLMGRRQEGEGLPELTLRLLGPVQGRLALAVMALWFTLYAGFILRSGADRLIVTIFPEAEPALFSVVMGLLALTAALGSERSLVRTARMAQPVVLGALLIILGFALFSVKPSNLLPLTAQDALPTLEGAAAAADILSLGLYSLCFLEGCTPKAEGRFRAYALWLTLMTVLLTLIIVAVVGCFGAELTKMLSRPFFSLMRNLVFFQSVERVEALVVMLWIFPDFLLVSLCLTAAQRPLRLMLGRTPVYNGEGAGNFKNGRYMIWLCTAAAIVAAIFIGPDSASMDFWSQLLIPAINLGFAFLFLPLIYLAAKLRKAI